MAIKSEKKPFWSPNGESVLTNSLIRWVNYIGLFLFGSFNLTFLLAFIEENIEIHNYVLFIPFAIALGMSLSCWILIKVIKNTDFFMWDYTERKKRDRFVFTSFWICGFLSVLSIVILFLNIYIIWFSIENKVDYYIGFDKAFLCIVNIVACFLFLINPIWFVELYYPLFEDNLTTGYKIQKMPDNWMENGKEIRNEDEHKEIFKRDFGIDLD